MAPPPVASKRVDIRGQVQKLANGLCEQVHVNEMKKIVSKLLLEGSTVSVEKEKQVLLTLMGLIGLVGERNVRVKGRQLTPIGTVGKCILRYTVYYYYYYNF